MKRNLIYLIVLIAVAALVFYLFKYRSSGTLNIDEQNFSVKDTASVGKIFIADMQGNKIEVTRTTNGWMMNNKRPASKEAVDMILSTLNRMGVRYPVPDATRPTVVKEMSGNNKKVVLFDREGKEIKTILIGSAPLDYRGNYMIIEGAENPYVVEIPGFQGSLETRFITDTTELRNRTILTVTFNDLVEISVLYNDKPDSSFAINLSKPDSFSIYNPMNNISLQRKLVNKEKLFQYIAFLKQVNCEAYESDSTKSLIIKQRPFCKVTVRRRDNSQTIIECYYKPIDRRSKSQTDVKGNPLPYDLDRFYGLVNGKDFVLLQQYHFGQVLRSMNYFKV